MNIFLTGGTGFIGKQVLTRLVAQEHRVYALVRDVNRFARTLHALRLGKSAPVIPIQGDLTKPELGMNPNDRKRVLQADMIIHAGGPMNIQLDQCDAERSFLHPAWTLAALAADIHRLKGLRQFIHVVGFMSPYDEQNFMAGHDLTVHAPPYERMKFQADLYLRQALQAEGIPLSTVNPSVVIGDSFSGKTEQIGGLSILVEAVRRNLMPFAPGGKRDWIPMVHLDHAADFIANLVHEHVPASNTYYLLDAKKNSPSVRELIGGIADELQVRRPVGSVPLALLKLVLSAGIGKRLGIPAESMNFIVETDFPVEAKLQLESRNGGPTAMLPATLPYVIADLDYRLSHPLLLDREDYVQRRIADLIVLEREGAGPPVIVLHGTFSGSDSFLPFADALEGMHVCLVDLPGFGRSPRHRHHSFIDGYVDAVIALIGEFDCPVRLIGHSFGGWIAAKVMERIGPRIESLTLLQPVLHPVPGIYRHAGVTRSISKHLPPLVLRRMLLKNRDFTAPSEQLDRYGRHLARDLKSPRIRAANAKVMSALTLSANYRFDPQTWESAKVYILWGERDRDYVIPDSFDHIDRMYVPYGHQFPLEAPALTAEWVTRRLHKLSRPPEARL